MFNIWKSEKTIRESVYTGSILINIMAILTLVRLGQLLGYLQIKTIFKKMFFLILGGFDKLT